MAAVMRGILRVERMAWGAGSSEGLDLGFLEVSHFPCWVYRTWLDLYIAPNISSCFRWCLDGSR